MKTPTKEQITEILGQMQRQGWFWDSIDYEDEYAVLRFIITEWERIKEQKKMLFCGFTACNFAFLPIQYIL